MKKKNVWFRWIAWGLLLVMCINSIGTITLAADVPIAETEYAQETFQEEEPILLEERASAEEEIPSEEVSAAETVPPAEETQAAETVPSVEETQAAETVPSAEETQAAEDAPSTEETPATEETLPEPETVPVTEEPLSQPETVPTAEETLPETEKAPQEETVLTEESTSGTEAISEEDNSSELLEAETESELFTEELTNESKAFEVKQGFDIDFYVIIEGEKVRLQHNGIPSILTWKDGRKFYHGISTEDLISVYEEFGFAKGSDGQNPNPQEQFVSAYRGRRGIEYGTVYTDTVSGKTYVSYNDGENKQGEAVDVYYVPNGKGGWAHLADSVKKDNSFYSVRVKGEGQDQLRYALINTTVEVTVSDYNPDLHEKTDRIEWTCVGSDDTVVDGTQEVDQTTFTIGSIKQSYEIQRADQSVFDIQFYVYADNEIRRLPSSSLKKVYKWNNNGRCCLAISDLAKIYKEFGLNENDTQFGRYFPYAIRGEKTLAHAAMEMHNGKQYVSYTLENQSATIPTDVYYMPKGADKRETVPQDVADGSGNITSSVAEQLKQNKHSFYSVTVIQPDGSRRLTYHKKDEDVVISVDQGMTKPEEWLCVGENEKTIQPKLQGSNLQFTIYKIEQPYTIACNTFAPDTLNIKFYTFVDYERYNVAQVDVPVYKDTTTKEGTTYYYISNEQLKEYLKKFHYDGTMTNGDRERFYYSKRDYDSLHNAGTYSFNGQDYIYVGKTGEPMDVYYLPDGEVLPLLNAKTLMEYHDNRYNGFYSVKVLDEKGQVYTPTELENLPAIDFVARKGTLTRTVSTKPHAEGQAEQINWECRREDGTLSGILGVKDETAKTMSFTITGEDAVRPYVIVPDNTEKPSSIKEANISFYVFIDGDYKLLKNINVEQHYIAEAHSGRTSRYYLRAKDTDAISQIYKEFGFTSDKLEPGADGKEKILFGYATDTRVFVQHPYKDTDGTWYIPVLKNGHDVSVYYFSHPNPLNPDRIENYFDRLTGLSAQIGVAGRHFDVEGSFHLVEVLDPLNLTEGKAISRQYVAHGESYTVEVPKKATLAGEYQGKDIRWSCTSDDQNIGDVIPDISGADTIKYTWPSIAASYQVVADKPKASKTFRIVYDTTRYMKKLPKEAKLTPQVGNKTRFSEDIPADDIGVYEIRAPYPLTYDHEDNNSKELEMYEFDHWDYKDANGRWKKCDAGELLVNVEERPPEEIVFYASWSRVSDLSRRQVQFYICKSAMPEDGSVALPSINPEDYTSAVAVANCNVKASLLHDVPVLGNKNPTTWEHYANGHKRVHELLRGTRPDEGYIGNGDYIYKIDRLPSDEEVFQTIRENGRPIRIGQKEIPPSKLDTEFFTIYWYSFKSEMSDGWHIDGRIVAKNGYLTVKKDFVGTPEEIKKIQQNYFITVDMDETFSDGTPQPPAFHEHMKLVLPSQGSQTTAAGGAELVVGTWDDAEHTSCTWIVKADPFWKYTLREHNFKPDDPQVKFSGWYNVHNSHEAGENVNTWELYPENSGIKFTGRGMGRGGEALTIELENRYQRPGVLTLNKFDASTGHGMQGIVFDVMTPDGIKKETVKTDKNGIAEFLIPLQDETGANRTATETYLLREKNVPTGYIDAGDVQITVAIAGGAFKITEAKLVDRAAGENQEEVKAPVNGQIDGKSVLTIRGDTNLNIRNFSKSSALHIKKIWELPNDALTEKQVKVRLYRNGRSTGQEFVLSEENNWEHTIDKVPLFLDMKPVEYKIEEVEIGKTHYSPEFGDGFLYYEVIYPKILYKDTKGAELSPTTEEEFEQIARMELEVQNLHFNLAERSFLKTDDLPRKRLPGAEFMLYEVPYKEGTSEYVDDTGYTVECENQGGKDTVVLKKDGQICTPFNQTPYVTDGNGMLLIPETVPRGRYWMVESTTPNKDNKLETQYEDNLSLYMVEVENEIVFLYEKEPGVGTWKALADRHVVNHPHKGGVTVQIEKEVTGPFGNRQQPFEIEVFYFEDGQPIRQKASVSLKDGDKITLTHVALGSDIQIQESVDLSKYEVLYSQKIDGGTFSKPQSAQKDPEKKNTAAIVSTINGTPGDVIVLKITNQNTEDAAPDTGIRLEKNLYVWMLILISITVVLFFWRRKKNRADLE